MEQLGEFLFRSGMPIDVGAITREHVESFLLDLEANGWKPASRVNRFRSLQQLKHGRSSVSQGRASSRPRTSAVVQRLRTLPEPTVRL